MNRSFSSRNNNNLSGAHIALDEFWTESMHHMNMKSESVSSSRLFRDPLRTFLSEGCNKWRKPVLLPKFELASSEFLSYVLLWNATWARTANFHADSLINDI